jgi:hypothetical protein
MLDLRFSQRDSEGFVTPYSLVTEGTYVTFEVLRRGTWKGLFRRTV